MSDDKNFLHRWSRLKQRDAGTTEPVPAEQPKDEPAAPAPGAPTATPKDEGGIDLSKLPSIESLTKDSDYSLFMRKGVPDDLRRQALRRLWQTNPELAAPDLLEMNMFDYTGNDGPRPLFQPVVGAVVEAIQRAITPKEGTPSVDKAPASSDEKPAAESETESKSASQPGSKEPPNRG